MVMERASTAKSAQYETGVFTVVGAHDLDRETQTRFSKQFRAGVPRLRTPESNSWTCGHGHECGTNSLSGAAVAMEEWGCILPEMDMVPAPSSGLPACGREFLPAESCLDT